MSMTMSMLPLTPRRGLGLGAIRRSRCIVSASSASTGGDEDHHRCGTSSSPSSSKALHSPLFPLIAEHKSDSLSARCESSKSDTHHSHNRRIVITHALADNQRSSTPLLATAESAVIEDKVGTVGVGRLDQEEIRRIGDNVKKMLAEQSEADYLPATALLSLNALCHVGICYFTIQHLAQICSAPSVAPLLANWSILSLDAMVTLAKTFTPNLFLLFTSLGLIADNTMLAIGRFVGPNEIFGEFSRIRYLVHAATPAVIFVGLSISFDAGMPIDPLFLGALSVSATSLVIHTLNKSLNWTLMPAEAKGVMHYTPTETKVDFMRLLPVIFPMIVLLIDSWRTVLATGNMSLWPYPVAMTFMFIMGSIPGKVMPHFLAGNLGEVVFMAGLVASRGMADHMFLGI